ncbi:MAG: carboxypeptidase, partial [bacterium]|nr:carboxypeptidase [bacterium]
PQELALRFAEHLVHGYGHDADATWLLDEHEIHLMINSNPDGRQRAQELAWWRKNADNDHCSDSDDRGVDLNRNFEVGWGAGINVCSSTDPCDPTFLGNAAGSEPEIQAIENYLLSVFPPQIDHRPEEELTGVFFDLHSSGQWLSWAWFYTSEYTVNNAALQTLGRRLGYLNGYDPYPPYGACGGGSVDYAYSVAGVAGYLMELGSAFFEDCEVFEQTILPDNLEALIYAAKVARSPFWTPAGPDVTSIELLPGTVVAPGEPVEVRALADDTRFNHSMGNEPVQQIAAAEMTLDDPPWSPDAPPPIPFQAVDGNFSDEQEGVSAGLDTSGLELGRHTLYLRAQDASGRWGAVSAVFVWISEPGSIFSDGFQSGDTSQWASTIGD